MLSGRFVRTVASLHPLQIVARPIRWAQRGAFQRVPANGGPRLRDAWPHPNAAMLALAVAERGRFADRVQRLPPGSLLCEYESNYALDLDLAGPPGQWASPIALHPYPASVRARRLAVATRLGAAGLGAEITRACRAVAAQPEIHLLANHLLENGLGLVCGAAVCNGREADIWWVLGCSLLNWQLGKQFCSDGGHFERSASYHAALVAGLLEAIALGEDAGRSVPSSWRETAEHGLLWLNALRAPDGTYPLFNDASLDAAPATDDVIALGRSLRLGAPSEPGAKPKCVVLAATGWVVLEARDGAWLALDAGPDGAAYQPAHVHADALTLELWVNGRRAVVDYGVESYQDDRARQRTRATRSHSTVELESSDSCEVWGAFRVGRRQKAVIHSARVERYGTARVVASHDGYRHLPGAPVHRRDVMLDPGRLTVVDHIEGADARGVSRLRVDAREARRLQITGSGPVECVDDVWHPRYAEPHAAIVLSQPVRTGRPSHFTVEWHPHEGSDEQTRGS